MPTLLSVRLTERHTGTGCNSLDAACSRNQREISNLQSLAIVQYPEDPGYFLLHLRGSQSIADTYHLTLQDALDQANFQFGVPPEEWEKAPGAAATP